MGGKILKHIQYGASNILDEWKTSNNNNSNSNTGQLEVPESLEYNKILEFFDGDNIYLHWPTGFHFDIVNNYVYDAVLYISIKTHAINWLGFDWRDI